MKTGKVYLVGAGPGEPGLITVKGLECLKQAEVVVYDHLLDKQLLGYVPEQAEKIYAGKSASEHAMEQEKINRLLVDKAKAGKLVVRLKGGDPFVLGRGGEEAEALVEEGIEFEVVPGITSAIAVPAYAGIPVTHRGISSSFAVITGHEDPNKEISSIDWKHLATGVDTLVFLLGKQNLAEIASKLVEHGRRPDTPVAVVADGTRPQQRTVAGTLENIASKVKKSGLGTPAIIVVGDVVGLREKLRWFDNRPLVGKRILVTRARHQASALSKLLASRGAIPIELPAIDIQPADSKQLDRPLKDISQYHWTIFTSVNGVDAFFNRIRALGKDVRILHGIKIGAIGPATAGALEGRGITPDYVPTVYTSEGILDGMKNKDVSGKRFLLLRADIADRGLVEGLQRLGAEVDETVAYQTLPATDSIVRARQLIDSGEVDVITFASSSTVSNLAKAVGGARLKVNGAKVACIGPKTAETAAGYGLKVDIMAKESTIPGLVAAIEEYFQKEK